MRLPGGADELAMTDAVVDILKIWRQLDLSGVLVLGAVFVVCALVPIPRTALCLASGAIFGLPAIPVILPSTTLGAVMGFLLARYLFAERLQRLVNGSPKLRAVLDAVDDEGWRVVGLMRFAGPLPNFAQNFMFGLTRIEFWPFTVATFVFTIPQICLYVYLGAIGKEILLDRTLSPLSLGLGCVAALTVLAIILLIARRARVAFTKNASSAGIHSRPSFKVDLE
jgi:uncharacterized membrane protein YdjX (TVP38/TMEM64 family)